MQSLFFTWSNNEDVEYGPRMHQGKNLVEISFDFELWNFTLFQTKMGDIFEVTCNLSSEQRFGLEFIATSKTDGLSEISVKEAEAKAEKEAETKFFQHLFGVDSLQAFIVDELGRPVTQNWTRRKETRVKHSKFLKY